MKIKKLSLVALSLLLSLSALHAIPGDPTKQKPDNPDTASGTNMVVLFPQDSKNPVQISVGQLIQVILPITSENGYSFSDSSLFGANTVPYTFDFTGSVTDPNSTVTLDCANMGKEANNPVIFQRGEIACSYMHFDDDTTPSTSDTEYYTPIITNEFSFVANTPGVPTTLTFSDGRHTYTYPITVVAAPAN